MTWPLRAAGFALAAALATAGCASPAPRAVVPPAAAAAVPAPWTVPAERYGTQSLYRVRFAGPDGDGSLRLTLRLAAAGRYQARAADAFGRPVWGLDVDPAGGLWVDHRRELVCRPLGRLDLAGVPLAPFPLAALPPLLLGRLPAPPADPAAVATAADRVEFRDAEGRRWSADLEAGEPRAWTLWGKAGRPRVSWQRAGEEAVLSDLESGVQLRWRETVREPLAAALEPLAAPPGYRLLPCRQAWATADEAPI